MASCLAGCRGDRTEDRPRQFFPDLDDQEKNKAQTESTFYAEYETEDGAMVGRAARRPVFGTVPFGAATTVASFGGVEPAQRGRYLRTDMAVTTGKRLKRGARGEVMLDEEGMPQYELVERIPIPVTKELLELGQKKFQIYCLPCHGATGAGDGMVGKRWSYALPTWHDPKYLPGGEFGQDGHVFDVIRNGLANPGGEWPLKMPSYGRKLTIEETWAIVAYFRALQITRRGTPEMLPEPVRLELERRRSDSGGGGAAIVGSGAEGGAS